ncbi:MAG TPA: bifunctional [glutamate--ammonia ligase]-adenylyl-L-tyrosine phosphorylase/[glutamate--ammonia-ligase] adenylyltransferase [Thermodesulfovibrionales bacterium]|nr:bifunctional [glutamate--ammonia ligase]-adenylyl-L-tyrosine phosphorylase/[glutamate--ammonia-ligase] adenylyltransferase [Thermodesulfovibrionales bacterium]
MREEQLRDAASATPDPERALKNLLSFCEVNPEYSDRLASHLRPVSLLFSISQFLANFASSEPEALFDALVAIHEPVEKETVLASLRRAMGLASPLSGEGLMRILRSQKKRMLLLITLRDITGKSDIVESMQELSVLAEAILEEALKALTAQIKETYGEPEQDAFSIISVGKLGSNELNFSSDIDLLYVYGHEGGETSGIITQHGVAKNRISNHEFYSKLGEGLNRVLAMNTEEGFVYRVDLRLRPEGQRGSLAMSLPAYEIYYESWGRAWERAVLLRARPVAGDPTLGREFLETVRPFVYRKYLDFNAIDEIRKMKTKIDETFKKDDIKRGHGGIREIEFFVHALQLIYGGREPLLRERSTLKGLHRLLQKSLIGSGDYATLSEEYRYLRTLEHRLQQLNDLQTHSLPSGGDELALVGRKMGLPDGPSFLSDLEERRMMVRRIYDSLFVEKGPKDFEKGGDAFLPFSEELSDDELRGLLAGYPLRDKDKVVRNIRHMNESMHSFQTLRGQRLLGEILPAFLQEALRCGNPDAAVNNLEVFAALLASEESYLDLFAQKGTLIPLLIHVFSRSEYLAKMITKRKEYLEFLGQEMFTKKSLLSLKKELGGMILSGRSLAESVRVFKQMGEIGLGIMFLDRKIDIVRLIRELSKIAEAIVSVSIDALTGADGLAVIALGKSGGRELTFNSDLDLIFVCRSDVAETHVKTAERLIRLLISYTQDGMAYSVDARLRPEGSKGPLVSSIAAFRDYYFKAAHFWEFQALLKARPVAGDSATGCLFMDMKRTVLREKGAGISPQDIKGMRGRIQRVLSKEAEGFDIKLGPGGLEELEFTVQYLQLLHLHDHEELMVQRTLDGIRRLGTSRVIDKDTLGFMRETYMFYRTLETLQRLINEPILKEDSDVVSFAVDVIGFRDGKEFFRNLKERRLRVKEIFENLL